VVAEARFFGDTGERLGLALRTTGFFGEMMVSTVPFETDNLVTTTLGRRLAIKMVAVLERLALAPPLNMRNKSFSEMTMTPF
jgi:hypothetical protein